MTKVLTMVDRFLKMVHFLAFPKLPTAKETAKSLVNQVFRLHDLPNISDQGPEFTSQSWDKFCRLLGLSVNLSSGFSPQTNGQSECLIKELLLDLLGGHHPDQSGGHPNPGSCVMATGQTYLDE